MDATERKNQILKCSKKLFSEHGYYNTQIADIIREAGIARGTVYQYFKHKDHIFSTLIENFYNDWQQSISLNLGQHDLNSMNPRTYLYYRVKNTLEFLESDRDLCNIVLRMGLGLQEDFEKLILRFEQKIINLITEDLKLGIQFHNIPEDLDLEFTANMIAGSLFRISYHYFVVKDARKKDVEDISRKVLEMLSPAIFIKRS